MTPLTELSSPGRPRVVDFSTHVSGPATSQLLVGLGADVVKVENTRSGDGNRAVDAVPYIRGTGIYHVAFNAGTRSVAIDRNADEWDEVTAALVAWADVVIVGGRPDTLARRGLDLTSLLAHNPELVYCAISGYGEVGPWRDMAAHGQNPDALAGLVDVAWVDGQPTTPGWRPVGTIASALHGALGIMDGLYRRSLTRQPQYVGVSLWQSAMWWNWRDLTALANLDHEWGTFEDFGSRYAMYATRDARALLVAPIEEKFWIEFCNLLGLPDSVASHGDWSSRYDFGDGPDYADERALIAERMRERTLNEWVDLLAATSVPACPVLDSREALASEHARELGVMATTAVAGQDVEIVASPIRRSADIPGDGAGGPQRMSPPPQLGEHTLEVLAELGLDHVAARHAPPAGTSRAAKIRKFT